MLDHGVQSAWMSVCVFVMSTGETESIGRSHGSVQLSPEACTAHGQVRASAQTDHQGVPRDRARVSRSQGEWVRVKVSVTLNRSSRNAQRQSIVISG